MIGATARRTLRVHRNLLVAMSGLDGDVLTFSDDLAAQLRLLRLQEVGLREVVMGADGEVQGDGEDEVDRGYDGDGVENTEIGARKRDTRRRLAPHSLAKLVSTKLYAQRRSPFYVEPVIAGLTSDGEPFLWTSDALGAPMTTDNFVVAGSCSASLAGICEAL